MMDERFLQASGTELFNGNELIVKGGLESKLALLTGYPGSPVAEIFDVAHSISTLLNERGILAELANNEALGAARLNGSQMLGVRGMVVMKSVGLHVAADALAISNFAGVHEDGGAVVLVGDDPWNSSTQVPADSRFLSRHLFIPVVEPGTYQEMKDWIALAFELSQHANLYICVLVTTNLVDGGGTVELAANSYPTINTNRQSRIDPEKIDGSKRIIIPPDTSVAEADVIGNRFPKLLERVAELGLNKVLHPATAADKNIVGFAASGMNYLYLEHALYELGLTGEFPILKLGMTYPLDENIVNDFAKTVDNIVVIEEKRPFIEESIRDILTRNYRDNKVEPVSVWGKQFPSGAGVPATRGLNPGLLIGLLITLFESSDDMGFSKFKRDWNAIKKSHKQALRVDPKLPIRMPSFCPGCPHRDTGVLFKDILKNFLDADYMRETHNSITVKPVFNGDIGCYAMFKYPPFNNLIHNMSSMGLGGGTGRGVDPFISNKQVVFVGDGTFFHSEMVAVSDSIKNGHDITYIILDNKTTAMTGHQSTPGISDNVMGGHSKVQNISAMLEGFDKDLFVVTVDPENRSQYQRVLERTILMDGVKIIIADKECGITYNRKLKRKKAKEIGDIGFLAIEKHVNVTEEVCEHCLECTKQTACPGLTFKDTPYGRKVQTDISTCVIDLSCARINACPSFETVTVKRKRPAKKREFNLVERDLPKPRRKKVNDVWYAYSAGVGGMGIGVVSTVLSRAGMKEGYHVRFNNKKGLAIRNGGVFSHTIFMKENLPLSPLVPFAKADLLLGLDLVECGRTLDPRTGYTVVSKRTAVVVNTAIVQTISTLLDRDHIDAEAIEELLKKHSNTKHYRSANMFKIAENFFDSRLYANMMLLGVAWQLGKIPVSLDSMLWAIQRTVKPSDVNKNIQAFKTGRHLAAFPEDFADKSKTQTADELVEEKFAYLLRGHDDGPTVAREYKGLCEGLADLLKLDDYWMGELYRRVYDCLQWDDSAYAKHYADQIIAVYEQDTAEYDYAVTKAVIMNLAKVMCIKDEVYVAELLLSDEKMLRDKERYNVDSANGDEIVYSHHNRPRLEIGSFKLEFNINTKNWMLAIMRKCKWIRNVLPGWHRQEREFRDWYSAMVAGFQYNNHTDYDRYLQSVKVPELVRGYREFRYPAMHEARAKADDLLGLVPEEKS